MDHWALAHSRAACCAVGGSGLTAVLSAVGKQMPGWLAYERLKRPCGNRRRWVSFETSGCGVRGGQLAHVQYAPLLVHLPRGGGGGSSHPRCLYLRKAQLLADQDMKCLAAGVGSALRCPCWTRHVRSGRKGSSQCASRLGRLWAHAG